MPSPMSAGTRGLNAEGPGDAIDLEKVWEDVKGTRDFSVLYQLKDEFGGFCEDFDFLTWYRQDAPPWNDAGCSDSE